MPPQPGMFPISFSQKGGHSHRQRQIVGPDPHANESVSYSIAPRPPGDETKKDKRRREIAGNLSKEMDRREDIRQIAESMHALHETASNMSTHPEESQEFLLRLYPISLERAAILAQLASEEENAHEGVRIAWEEERDRVEDEYRKGRDRVRERLLEGIEERRRRAREEKDGEGITDAALDSQSRPHITRKLRNKLGTSPPPTPFKTGQLQQLSATVVPVPNPNSLSVDELPSPFPLPLTSTAPPNGHGNTNGHKRKAKGGGVQPQALTGLGKAISQLTSGKEIEIDTDLGEIRRGTKRKRAAATSGHKP